MSVTPKELKWLKLCVDMAPVFSTCAKRQYYAVVLSPNGRVAGVGYNGSPPGMDHCVDGACPRLHANAQSGSNYDTCIATHAEANALVWSDPSMRIGGTLIVNGTPCMTCAKLIVSSGIKRVVYISDPSYINQPLMFDLFTAGGVYSVGVLA